MLKPRTKRTTNNEDNDKLDRALTKLYQAGDVQAGDEMIRLHYGILTVIARRQKHAIFDDIFQEVCLGFLKGLSLFDFESYPNGKPYAFACGYAGWSSTRAGLAAKNRIIYIPENVHKKQKANDGVCLREVVWLDTPTHVDQGQPSREYTYYDFLVYDEPNSDETIEREQHLSIALKRLDRIKGRNRRIVELRFGLTEDDSEEKTLEQIGQMFDLTRERVRQIVNASLEIMKK